MSKFRKHDYADRTTREHRHISRDGREYAVMVDGSRHRVSPLRPWRGKAQRRASRGFYGYDWMVDSIVSHGEIHGPTCPLPAQLAESGVDLQESCCKADANADSKIVTDPSKGPA